MFLLFQNSYFALGSTLFIPWQSDGMKALFTPKLQTALISFMFPGFSRFSFRDGQDNEIKLDKVHGWYYTRKEQPKFSREKSVPVPLSPAQISHLLARDQTWAPTSETGD
jgi:hypothetical protein